jgi:hypothetical protein
VVVDERGQDGGDHVSAAEAVLGTRHVTIAPADDVETRPCRSSSGSSAGGKKLSRRLTSQNSEGRVIGVKVGVCFIRLIDGPTLKYAITRAISKKS